MIKKNRKKIFPKITISTDKKNSFFFFFGQNVNKDEIFSKPFSSTNLLISLHLFYYGNWPTDLYMCVCKGRYKIDEKRFLSFWTLKIDRQMGRKIRTTTTKDIWKQQRKL